MPTLLTDLWTLTEEDVPATLPTTLHANFAPVFAHLENATATKQKKYNTSPKKVSPEPEEDFGEVILRFYFTISNGGVVYFKIYHQSPKATPFVASNGLRIRMDSSPEINPNTVYLRGTSKNLYNRMCSYEFGSTPEAEAFKAKVIEALVEMVNSVRKVPVSVPVISRCDLFEL